MNASLHQVPPYQRRRAALVAGGFALLLLIVGVLPWTAPSAVVLRIAGTFCMLLGVVFALIAWGLAASARIDRREQALSAAVADIVGDSAAGCACGHDHDPDDLEFADAPAEGAAQIVHHTGKARPVTAGAAEPDCATDSASCEGHGTREACATCVLAANGSV